MLNCSCNDVEMDGDRIRSIKGWQGTAETWHTVEADLFADCSGDSGQEVLQPRPAAGAGQQPDAALRNQGSFRQD